MKYFISIRGLIILISTLLINITFLCGFPNRNINVAYKYVCDEELIYINQCNLNF